LRKILISTCILIVVGAGFAWWITAPKTLPADAMAGITGTAAKGETIFYAAGCASCHAAPDAAEDAMLVLAGGRALTSDFGTFYAPNISPDVEHGIGGWTAQDLANAMKQGVSPDGQHLYPAFPYTTYTHASLQDIADLYAFLQTLPADATPSKPHEIGFPFNIRRALGGWKLLFLNDDWVLDEASSAQLERGRYLVEGLGHCAKCHTPRNAIGGLDTARWLGGAPNPSGEGSIPNITSGGLSWSESEIAEYLKSGFTPDFDVVGGEMADVVGNIAHLTDEDRAAIAAYVKAVPAVPAN
jgi:mono/diheme cytochrome c family protein